MFIHFILKCKKVVSVLKSFIPNIFVLKSFIPNIFVVKSFIPKSCFLNKFVLKIPDDEFWDLIKFGK
jgi:hypothetical protein